MNVFEKIVSRQIPADIVYEDALALAFRDVNPVAPVHVLVIPKRSVARLGDTSDADRELLGHLLSVCRIVAEREGIAASGYRVVTNNGGDGGQSVDHLHLHVLGGRAMRWPPG
ncbi:MAG: histidine triad nucleotide-binding protein [Myxococcota bacterium]